MQDGIVVKGLAPKLLDPSRYHLNPRTDFIELEKGMPRRTIKDEFGKFKWIETTRFEPIKSIHTQSNRMPQPCVSLLTA